MTWDNWMPNNVVDNEAASIPQMLFMPHYTDHRFRQPRTVFLRRGYTAERGEFGNEIVNGAEYAYSDRVRQWYPWEKCREAWDAATKVHPERSAALVQAYLRDVMTKPALLVVHIVAGVNVSNGYPYQVYGFIVERQNGGDNDD